MNSKSNNQPLVSICIPTYNGEKFIASAIESAQNQTYQNIEIIITDDNSSDNTLNICNRYAARDERIKIFSNANTLGLQKNWQQSITNASSNWIKYLFQDDILLETCVERMINAAICQNVYFVMCNRTYVFERSAALGNMCYLKFSLPRTEKIFTQERVYTPTETARRIAPYIFHNCMGEPPSILFNKKIYSEDLFPGNYFQLIDYIFVLNNILRNDFVYIPDKLVKFRVHGSTETMRNTSKNKGNEKAFHRFLYTQCYEALQLCNEICEFAHYSEVRKHIDKKEIDIIRKWLVLRSYRWFGYKYLHPFYKDSKLRKFILNDFSSDYSLYQYLSFKWKYKKYIKKYSL